MRPAPSPASTARAAGREAEKVADGGLRVASAVVGGVADKLTDVVVGLLDFLAGPVASDPAPKKVTATDYLNDPAARQAYMAQKAAARRRNEALDHMREDVARGRNLDPADVRSLAPDDLENIKARGDAYLMNLIRQREEEQKRQRDHGGRERDR